MKKRLFALIKSFFGLSPIRLTPSEMENGNLSTSEKRCLSISVLDFFIKRMKDDKPIFSCFILRFAFSFVFSLLFFLSFRGLIIANDSDVMTKSGDTKISSVANAQDMSIILQRYPAFAKIISQGRSVKTKDLESTSYYYGSGVYVAEQGEFGVVLTNAHVISEAEGTIQVKFANFSSEGVVLLIDEVWDIAALIIHKPPFLPVPISLEVPLIDEKLWLAGFGQNHDLSGFRMVSGTVYKYATIELYPDLPAETLMIEPGIRNGDSGGPILNQYGELAGLIWGSDGSITTGTFSLRLQAFLTQTQFQLENMDKNDKNFWTSLQQTKPKRILMASTPAQKALKTSGIYPISSIPIYRHSNSIPNNLLNVSALPDNSFPPYPAKLSPTYIALKNAIGHEHPEVYLNPDSAKQPVADLSDFTDITVSKTVQEVPLKQEDSLAVLPNSSQTSPPYASYYQDDPSGSANDAESTIAPEALTIEESQITDSSHQKDQNSEGNNQENNPTSNFQIIIVVAIILFLFFNTVRLLTLASKKDE